MLSSKRVLRMLALAVALIATSFSLKSVGTAEAANSIIDCDYFSDATYTVLVGSRTRLCNGQYTTWGTITSYKICITEPCGV